PILSPFRLTERPALAILIVCLRPVPIEVARLPADGNLAERSGPPEKQEGVHAIQRCSTAQGIDRCNPPVRVDRIRRWSRRGTQVSRAAGGNGAVAAHQ